MKEVKRLARKNVNEDSTRATWFGAGKGWSVCPIVRSAVVNESSTRFSSFGRGEELRKLPKLRKLQCARLTMSSGSTSGSLFAHMGQSSGAQLSI